MVEILKKNILHGRVICNEVINHFNGKLPEITISENIEIVTVIDKSSISNASLKKVNIKNSEVKFLMVDKYIKWTSKIEETLNYLKNNYNTLPEYVMYLDGSDTLIINDIINPKKILEYYNCKVLFNSEPDYWHTGASSPNDIKNYYDILYMGIKDEYLKKNREKYEFNYYNRSSLNAGVFLGEKDYVIKLLSETLDIMKDDYNKGFPYGCMDDQCVLKFLHNKYFDDISIDLFHTTMLWGTRDTLTDKEDYFKVNYLRKFKEKYEKMILMR